MQAGDSFSDDGYKAVNADVVDQDNKTWLGAEGHHHLGGTITLSSPSAPPTLTRSSTGGLIPAGTRAYYKISLYNAQGQESVASAEAYIDTPAAIVAPGGPTLSTATTGGALLGGDYYYALSAYSGISTNETKAIGTTFISVNSLTGTNKITLLLPSPPAGATGFNVYRRAPGESKYFFLDSVLLTGATPPTTYIDMGSIAENCDRTVPVVNSTNSSNSITVTYPAATVPTGYTWKIYRSFINGNFTSSLLKTVVEFTAEATPSITTSYTDVGLATGPGTPLSTVPTVTNPSKILLTNGAEVQGTLPPAQVAGFPHEVTFAYGGTLSARTGDFVWLCEYDSAIIRGCRAVLGVGKVPASTPVIVDVRKGSGQSGALTTVYTTTGNRPSIPVGSQYSTSTVPNITALVAGDMLTVDVIQAGGGASPTDANLLVTIYLWVISNKTTSSLP